MESGKRLFNQIICAEFGGINGGFNGSMTGYDNHLDRGIFFFDFFQGLDSVDPRHPDVEQNKIGGFGIDDFQGFVSIGGRGDFKTFIGEQPAQGLQYGRLIINN